MATSSAFRRRYFLARFLLVTSSLCSVSSGILGNVRVYEWKHIVAAKARRKHRTAGRDEAQEAFKFRSNQRDAIRRRDAQETLTNVRAVQGLSKPFGQSVGKDGTRKERDWEEVLASGEPLYLIQISMRDLNSIMSTPLCFSCIFQSWRLPRATRSL